jgi:hypothetical protein
LIASSFAKINPAAPSLTSEAFPAVTVPALMEGGRQLAKSVQRGFAGMFVYIHNDRITATLRLSSPA